VQLAPIRPVYCQHLHQTLHLLCVTHLLFIHGQPILIGHSCRHAVRACCRCFWLWVRGRFQAFAHRVQSDRRSCARKRGSGGSRLSRWRSQNDISRLLMTIRKIPASSRGQSTHLPYGPPNNGPPIGRDKKKALHGLTGAYWRRVNPKLKAVKTGKKRIREKGSKSMLQHVPNTRNGSTETQMA